MWPTVTINGNNNRKGLSPKSGNGLMTEIIYRERESRPWPTPTASGDLHYRLGGDSQGSKCLAALVVADAQRPRLEGHRSDAGQPPHPESRNRRPHTHTHTHTHTQQPACLKFPSPQSRDYRSGQTAPHGWGSKGEKPQKNLNDFVLTLRPASTTPPTTALPNSTATPQTSQP